MGWAHLDPEVCVEQALKVEALLAGVCDVHACFQCSASQLHTVHKAKLIRPLALSLLAQATTTQSEVQLDTTSSTSLSCHVFTAAAPQELPVVVPRKAMLGELASSMTFFWWRTENWEDKGDATANWFTSVEDC